jgi:hypothetical protein
METKCYCGHTITCDCGPQEIHLEDIFNDQKKEGLKNFIQEIKQQCKDCNKSLHTCTCIEDTVDFDNQEPYDFLPGFIKQFDPNEGEINGEDWTAVHFLKWLVLNKFKIVK